MTDTREIELALEFIFGLIVFIMFWRLCSNIGAIRKGIDVLSEYTLIKAKKEGIKKHSTQSEKDLVEKLR